MTEASAVFSAFAECIDRDEEIELATHIVAQGEEAGFSGGQIEQAARAFVGCSCTLNGEPARIVGRTLPHAQVAPLDPASSPVEFSWAAVARVMAAGGGFRS